MSVPEVVWSHLCHHGRNLTFVQLLLHMNIYNSSIISWKTAATNNTSAAQIHELLLKSNSVRIQELKLFMLVIKSMFGS